MLSIDSMKQSEITQSLVIFNQFLLISTTDEKGIIKDVSDGFCEVSGYSRDELIGKPHNIVRHPDTPTELFTDLWETIQAGKQWQGELENRKKDGSSYWVITTVFPRFDDNNKVIGYMSLRQDVTASKKLLVQEEDMKDQARNASMGEMVGIIAHQWMQPLASISTANVSLEIKMELDTLTDQDIKNSSKTIHESVKYLSETINNFRNFFKKDVTQEEISLIELINYSINISEAFTKKDFIKISFKVDADETNWMVRAISKNDFAHIILNLMKNSVDELVSKKTDNPYIEINLTKKDNTYTIEFLDNAGGIPEEIISNIFEKKFSTKGEEGTGLGLYMTRMIIEEHFKGKIDAHNEKDGACFNITLPAITKE